MESSPKLRGDHSPRFLDQEQLVTLRNAVDGSIFDRPDGSSFEIIKTFVEAASSISPKFFGHFTESLDHKL